MERKDLSLGHKNSRAKNYSLYSTNSTVHASALTRRFSGNRSNCCSQRRNAASVLILRLESSLPLPAGNSSSCLSAVSAGCFDFFVEFFRSMFFEKLAHFLSLWVQCIALDQLYHILGILHNPSTMSMFYGDMSAPADASVRRSAPGGTSSRRHSFSLQFRKRG